MRFLIFVITALVLQSCSVLPKEVRQENRAKAKIYKLAKKHHLQHIEFIEIRDTIIVPSVKLDTVFNWQQVAVYDTVYLDSGRLSVRIVRLPGDSIFITGECRTDTIYYHDTVTIERPIVKETDVWLIKAWRWVKGFWWLLFLIAILAILLRKAVKMYLP